MTGAIALALGGFQAQAGDPDPQELRERAELLELRAQQLKAAGEADRAEAALREVEKLRARGDQARRPDQPMEMRQQEIKRQLERAQAEIRELRAAGKEEQAMELKRHIQEMERQLARMDRTRIGQPRPPEERLARRGPGPQSEAVDPRQRLRHLEVAIDNLRAAGMPEPAERLAQQAEEMRRHLPPPPRMQPGPERGERPEAEIDQLRAEVQDLRQAVRELRARLEESRR